MTLVEWSPAERSLSRRIDRATAQLEAALEAGDSDVAAAWRRVVADLEAEAVPDCPETHAA